MSKNINNTVLLQIKTRKRINWCSHGNIYYWL